MKWTTLNFGKHSGLSLPQIILSDADWFFWALNKGVFWGRLAIEAEELAARARAIKIPKPDPENWLVEYRREDNGRFLEFDSYEQMSRYITEIGMFIACLISICRSFAGAEHMTSKAAETCYTIFAASILATASG